MLGTSLEELKAQMRPSFTGASPCLAQAHVYLGRMISPRCERTAAFHAAVMNGQIESVPERRKPGYKTDHPFPLETRAEHDTHKALRAATQSGAATGAAALVAAAAAQAGHHTVSRNEACRILGAAAVRREIEGWEYLSHIKSERDLRKNLRVFAGVQHLWAAWYTLLQELLGQSLTGGLLSMRGRIAIAEEARLGSGKDLALPSVCLEEPSNFARFEALSAFYDDALNQRDEAPWFDLERVEQGRAHPDWTYCQGIVASVRASLA